MKKITSILVACTVMLFAWQAQAQITQPTTGSVTVTSGTDFVDGDTYTDSGGAGGSYVTNEDGTVVFQALAGEEVVIDFTAFDVEASAGAGGQCWDQLTITGDTGGMDGTYAGDGFDAADNGNTQACLDGTNAGVPSLGPFTSADGGTLTFFFDSDGSVSQTGWEATITVQPAINPDAPIIACPGDIMADSFPGECSAEVNFGTPVAIDPNGGTVTVTQTMGPLSGDDFPVGDTIVEFTATNDDAPNEVTTCQFTVTVNDVEPPMITCPDNITVDNEAGLCGATVMYPDPIVMDNCFNSGVSTVSDSLSTLFATNNGLGAGSAVYFDVTTAGNDIMVTSLDVNTDDTTPITIEMWTRTGTSVGNESDPSGWAMVATATGTGAGTNVPSNVVLDAPATLVAGATTGVALVFVDADNNYTNGDGSNESFSNADLTIDLGASSAAPFTGTPFSPRVWNGSINYDVMVVSGSTPYTVVSGLASGDFFPVGTTTNTLEYVDAGGNAVQCSFDVTVLDVEAPVITCVGGPTFPTATVSVVDGQAITDGNPTTTSVLSVTDEFDITDLNVTLDITHTWVSDMDITLTSPAGTSVVIFDAGCSGDDLTMDLDDEAAGDLAACTAGVGPAYPDPAYVPTNPLSAFDGESTIGDWTLEVTDGAAGDDGTLNGWGITYEWEVAGVGGPTVILDANGVGMIDTSMFIDSATDNCGIASIALAGGGNLPDPTQTCGDVGAAISAALPPAESTANVAETGTIGSDYAVASVEIEITHSWDSDMTIDLVAPSGAELNLSDGNGGSDDNYTGTVFMDGGMDITAAAAPFTGTFEPQGGTFAAAFDGEDINGAWILRVTDNAGGDDGTIDGFCINLQNTASSIALFGCEDVGTNTVEVIVTDPSGNESVCTSTVTVVDETAPVLVCQDIVAELDENGEVTVVAEDLLAETPAIFNVMSIGSNNGSGGFGSTDFTVAVTDAATVTFDWDYTVADIAGFDSFGYLLNGVYTELTDPAMANQSGSGSVAVAPGDVFGFRSDTVDNDFGGNETVISNFAPGFEGQFAQENWNLTLDNSDGDAFFVEAIPAGPLSFDACGIEVLAINIDGMFTCEDIAGSPYAVQVFASDASNNAAVCTAMVTVADLLAPVLTCPEGGPVMTDPETQVYTFPDYFADGEATALDNCTDAADIVTTQDPAPGTTMGISDGNVVILTATDEYGNTSTCEFTVDIQVLGVEENELNAAITMYPNPATNQVTISNGSNLALDQAVIYDTNGKLINTIDLRAMQSEQVIDVADLATGVYMIQISSENATIVKRLIKQ